MIPADNNKYDEDMVHVLSDGGETSGCGLSEDDSTNSSYNKKVTPHARDSMDNCSDMRQRHACIMYRHPADMQQNDACNTANNSA